MSINPSPWPPALQIQYRPILEAALSPDGRHAVYVAQEPHLADDASRFISHLYLVSTVWDTEPVQLTYGAHKNHSPRWSQDGKHLAFVSDRAGKENIYVMRPFGGEAWPLTAFDDTGAGMPRWSPDGAHIAFRMTPPKSEERRKADKALDDPIEWDVDFDFQHLYCIAYTEGARELPEARQVTTGRFTVIAFDWLPGGRHLVFSHMPTPFLDSWPESRLARCAAFPVQPQDGSAVTDIAHLGDWVATPLVSPDHRWIACATGEPPHHWAFANRVVLYPAAGGASRPLARTFDGQCLPVGWSADSREVYVIEIRGFEHQIVALPVDGGAGRDVTSTPTCKVASAVNAHGQLCYIEQDFEQPHTVVFLDAAQPETAPKAIAVTQMPPAWPDDPYPQVEVIQWRAPDGLEIEGLLIYPQGYEPGRKYPLVLEVHGGPAGVYSRYYLGSPARFSDVPGLTHLGCAVLRPNPRGSSGYGRAFRFANVQDWGGGDYEDLMAGVDDVIARGIADPDRLGVLGWSYGGFMTSWIITQTHRFKAACVGAGVTNLMSFTGTADIPGFLPSYMGGEFWQEPDIYFEHSPMFQVAGARTPTLIQHGQNDIRVPLSQARELYNALKRQGVPVEMVIYPRQSHAVEEPRLLMRMKERTTAWFARWLFD